jgi:heme oxygenase
MAYVGDLARFKAVKPVSSSSAVKTAGWVFVVGSCATLGGAYLLWRASARAAAASLILLSPFPCPPGMPC